MSETNDFFRELKALAQDFQGLREDNARLLSDNERLQADLQRARAALDLNGAAVQPQLLDRLAELKAENEALRKELADSQESYHIVNTHLKNILQGKQPQ